MARKRKKGKQKNVHTLQHILSVYKSENYKQANLLLKKAKITSEESGKAKQLKVLINNQLAYQYLADKQFTKAIEQITPNFATTPKPNFPLALDKSAILLGIAYLYLGDFALAQQHLAQTIEKPETQSFYFYYIVAGLYEKQAQSFDTLTAFHNHHAPHFQIFDKIQQAYLNALFFLFKENQTKALEILEVVQPISHSQKNNFQALVAILKQDKKQIKILSSTKTVYKAFLVTDLTVAEKNYLTTYPVFAKYLQALEKQITKDSFKDLLIKSCQKEQLLTKAEINSLEKNKALEPVLHYIAYNQLSILLNKVKTAEKKDFAKEIKPTLQFFNKHHVTILTTIPESIYTYVIGYREINQVTDYKLFFKSVLLYLTTFKESLTAKQINAIGWEITNALISSIEHEKSRKVILKGINDILLLLPNMIGIKLLELLNLHIADSKNHLILDIFTYPSIAQETAQLTHKIEGVLVVNMPNPMGGFFDIFNDDDEEEEVEIQLYKESIEQLITRFVFAATKYPPHRKAKVILEVYKLLHKHIILLQEEHETSIDKDVRKKFEDSYKAQLLFFKVENFDSPFYLDYQKLVFANSLVDLNKYWNRPKAMIQYLAGLLANDQHVPLIEHLFFKISDEVKPTSRWRGEPGIEKKCKPYFGALGTLLVVIYDSKIIDNKLPVIRNFLTRYDMGIKEIIKMMQTAYRFWKPTLYINVEIFNETYKNFKEQKYLTLHYEIARVAVEQLDNIMLPLHYNTAGKILQLIMKLTNQHPDFNYDKALVKQLYQFIGKTLKKKQLKGLTKIYKDAKKNFKFL